MSARHFRRPHRRSEKATTLRRPRGYLCRFPLPSRPSRPPPSHSPPAASQQEVTINCSLLTKWRPDIYFVSPTTARTRTIFAPPRSVSKSPWSSAPASSSAPRGSTSRSTRPNSFAPSRTANRPSQTTRPSAPRPKSGPLPYQLALQCVLPFLIQHATAWRTL